MKVRDVIRMLEQDGWYLDRTRGSHRKFKHSAKSGLVTVRVSRETILGMAL
jgi:predicted RNA binding protein YcfA (HicA-like mRNA interferase family)